MKILAFSLIELMVVIAIVAVLSAIAVPAYKSYLIKANIAKNMQLIDSIARDAYTAYQSSGTFPTSINVNGVGINSGAWGQVAIGEIELISYNYNNSNEAVLLSIAMSGLDGITGYIAPTVGTPIASGGHSSVFYALRADDDVVSVACGHFASVYAADAIDFAYLPSSCQCAEVNTFYSTGAGC